MRLLDSKFRYVPSAQTNVAATWKRFGYRPTSESERRARQQRILGYEDAIESMPGANAASTGKPGGVRLESAPRKARNITLKLAVSE